MEETKINWGKELLDWAKTIAWAFVIVFVVTTYVFRIVAVDGRSMEDTLHHKDRLYMNQFFYTPQKGHIIVFRPTANPDRPYVKRVIATAGDTVFIDFANGGVYVNDELQDEPYIKEKTRNQGRWISANCPEFSKENPIKIEEGFIWAMGDNRNNSSDSRDLGPIPVKSVMGHALFRIWPLNKIGILR